MSGFHFPLAADTPDYDALQAWLDTARAAVPALDDAGIDAVMRHVRGKRAVLAGHWQGRPAVFRLAPPHASDLLAREWREATRIWPHMQYRRYRVPEPYLHLPEIGLMAVERVPGTPLLAHLWQSPPESRAAHLPEAATWLRRYSDVTESWHKANPAGWLARAERAAQTQPHARLQEIETQILVHLRRLAARLDGVDWRMAICHGDFHPNNLMRAADRLTGIDLGGSARLPVCKDIARFLVHMGRRGMIPSSKRAFGVDADGITAFVETFALTETERRRTLPFFLGIEALIRVEHRDMKQARLHHAEAMQDALRIELAATSI
ncbi:phosphotransferase [Roseovarius sp. D22-M7]|uniref:phosphotransferase n=1 Tax=Roseovarius sp. D22-M7 TaxID=3127116 RepID=UPI00301038F3